MINYRGLVRKLYHVHLIQRLSSQTIRLCLEFGWARIYLAETMNLFARLCLVLLETVDRQIHQKQQHHHKIKSTIDSHIRSIINVKKIESSDYYRHR